MSPKLTELTNITEPSSPTNSTEPSSPTNPLTYLSHSTNQYKPKVFTYGFKVNILPFREIPSLTAKGGYSTMQYRKGHRLQSNVIGFCPNIILDLDTKPNDRSYSIPQLLHYLDGLNAIIVTTVNHSTDTHREYNNETEQWDDVPQHRLRVIIALSTAHGITVDNYKSFLKTAIQFCRLDPQFLDSSCFSTDRQYAPNPNQEIHHIYGEDIPTPYILSVCEKYNPSTSYDNDFIYRDGDLDGSLSDRADYITSHTTPDMTVLILKDRGFRVTADLRVYYDNRSSHNMSIDPKSGLLRDWRHGTTHSTINMARKYIDPAKNKDLQNHLTAEEAVNYITDLIKGYHG